MESSNQHLTQDSRYTYDAWNRLVKVENNQSDPPTVIAEYGYDGLNRRITRTIGSDDAIHEYYTESWQRIESRPNGESSTTGVSLFVFGIRYIDDIVMRQRDANASGPPEERRYYLTDANYNVVMLVNDGGYGVERVFYTAYGEPECFPFGDADGDYDVDTADQTLITTIKNGGASYNILADLNLDGAVTQTDVNAFSAYSGALGGRNVLTASNGSATTGNDIGYAGYTWNDERAQWHVRHREYDPKLGRWLQRDPMGMVDGPNRYEGLHGDPLSKIDPTGMISELGPMRCDEFGCFGSYDLTVFVSMKSGDGKPRVEKTPKQKKEKDKDEDDWHARNGAYYEYTLICHYKCGTETKKFSGYTHNVDDLMKSLRSRPGVCCLSSFMISTHHSGGNVYSRQGDECDDSTFAGSVRLCDGATVDLNMCNSRGIAEEIRKNNPGKTFEIEYTDGENRHYPPLDIDLPGGDGEDHKLDQ